MTYNSPTLQGADELQPITGSAPKSSFTDNDTGTPLLKRLFTSVHNVALTYHYTKLMDRTGRVPFSSRKGFVSMGAKDDLDGDSIDNAAAAMVLLVKQHYPQEYRDRQLVGTNTMKRIIRDASRKTPTMLSKEEGKKITQDTLCLATTHPTVLTPWWNDKEQRMSTQNNRANFWIAAILEFGSLFYHKQWEIEQHTKTKSQLNPTTPR